MTNECRDKYHKQNNTNDYLAPNERVYSYNTVFFLFLYENIRCGYSLEVPPPGASIEYHNIYLCGVIRKVSVLLGSFVGSC